MRMLKVGITGGIGSGKSTVTNMIKGMGFPIIDADIVAREVFIIYPHILPTIKEAFGYSFFDEKGNLKRKEFGSYIFKNHLERKKYEDIIIPFVIKEIYARIKTFEEQNYKICFLDAPTLIENNLHKDMDVNILVWVGNKVQAQRVMLRDNLDADEAMNRIRAQMPLEEKKKFVDYIIDNEGSMENTRLQLDLIIMKLERLDVQG